MHTNLYTNVIEHTYNEIYTPDNNKLFITDKRNNKHWNITQHKVLQGGLYAWYIVDITTIVAKRNDKIFL